MKKIRVLVWAPKGSGTHYGGPGTSVYRLYKADANRRFLPRLAHGSHQAVDTNVYQENYCVREYGSTALAQLSYAYAAKRWLREHISEFDVFHGVNAYHACFMPAVYAAEYGKPAFVRVAKYRSDLATKTGFKSLVDLAKIRRKRVGQISGIIALSSAIVEELRGYGIPDDKIFYLPNGVDTHVYRPAKSQTEKRELKQCYGIDSQFVLLFCGAVIRRKRPHLLVEALGKLRDYGIDIDLLVVGPQQDPSYLREMQDLAEAGGYGNHIHWTGHLDQVAPIYQLSDFYGLPSAAEGMPNALLEAMATGLVSLSTDFPGARDLIQSGKTGFIVEPESDSIASTIAELLKKGERVQQIRRAALEKIGKEHDSQKVLESYYRIMSSHL